MRRRFNSWSLGDGLSAWRLLLPRSLGARILLVSLIVQIPLFAVLLAHNARLVE